MHLHEYTQTPKIFITPKENSNAFEFPFLQTSRCIKKCLVAKTQILRGFYDFFMLR